MVLVVKNPPANTGDIRGVGSIPESGRSPGEGDSKPLQYSHLRNPRNRAAWRATSPWGCKESDTTERLAMTTNWLSRLWFGYKDVSHCVCVCWVEGSAFFAYFFKYFILLKIIDFFGHTGSSLALGHTGSSRALSGEPWLR